MCWLYVNQALFYCFTSLADLDLLSYRYNYLLYLGDRLGVAMWVREAHHVPTYREAVGPTSSLAFLVVIVVGQLSKEKRTRRQPTKHDKGSWILVCFLRHLCTS